MSEGVFIFTAGGIAAVVISADVIIGTALVMAAIFDMEGDEDE